MVADGVSSVVGTSGITAAVICGCKCSHDDVTDAILSEASIFILFPLGISLTHGCWSCHGDR